MNVHNELYTALQISPCQALDSQLNDQCKMATPSVWQKGVNS